VFKTSLVVGRVTSASGHVPTAGAFDKSAKNCEMYRGADKSLARPTSRCILFDGENISFDASLVIYIIVIIFFQLWL
jgi:hypothetical protein